MDSYRSFPGSKEIEFESGERMSMDESVDVFAEPGLNINVSKVDLRSILGKVQGITGRKTNLAITENVLIETTGAGISIKATDFETGYVGMFPATVETEGRVALNAKKLFEIVRDFPSESINLNEIENRWIEIRNQKVEYHIVGMNPDDFPEVETLEDVSFFEMPSATLRRMLERTAFIMGSTEDRRPHITGVFLEDIRDEETGSVYHSVKYKKKYFQVVQKEPQPFDVGIDIMLFSPYSRKKLQII